MNAWLKCMTVIGIAVIGLHVGGPSANAADKPDPFGGKHVLVIGIDGCRSDSLLAAKAPNIKGLAENGVVCWKAYAGGDLGKKTEQVTVSGPGWASILTGVWADKHQVVNNKFENMNLKKVVDGKIAGYPHFFARIKEKAPNAFLASIVNWKPINGKLLSDADHQDSGSDVEVAKKCIALLGSDSNPSAIFLQFDEVDGAGHGNTYGPQSPNYMRVVESTDRLVGMILDAMRKRPNFAKEDWLVLVTADHGGINKGHGGQTPEERTVFLIANGGGLSHKVIDKEYGIVAIPPTVFRHLGIPVDPAWGLESPALGE